MVELMLKFHMEFFKNAEKFFTKTSQILKFLLDPFLKKCVVVFLFFREIVQWRDYGL